nr:uncharacterized protein LOC113802489 [Penaeus vannamei]
MLLAVLHAAALKERQHLVATLTQYTQVSSVKSFYISTELNMQNLIFEKAQRRRVLRQGVRGTTTAQGDFTPYGYVSRPGSTPLSYSLWGSNASTTSSEESYRRQFNRTLCRVVFGCAVLLVILAVLGIVGIAVYLGVLTNDGEGSEYEVRYRGQLKVTAGDTWIPDLARPASPAFRAKALKYEKMLESVYENSFLKGSLRNAKVLRILRNPENNRGLNLHFRLALDRRKMPSHVDNTELAVKDVLLQELMSLEPVAFQKVAIDIDSFRMARESNVTRTESAASSAPKEEEEEVQVIKVEGTQESPGGSIVIKKPSGTADRSQQEESSTVANLIYQFGAWRPVNPYNFRPSSPDPSAVTPANPPPRPPPAPPPAHSTTPPRGQHAPRGLRRRTRPSRLRIARPRGLRPAAPRLRLLLLQLRLLLLRLQLRRPQPQPHHLQQPLQPRRRPPRLLDPRRPQARARCSSTIGSEFPSRTWARRRTR